MLPSITKPKSAAKHAYATDRFALKISPILGVQLALAAADVYAVGQGMLMDGLKLVAPIPDLARVFLAMAAEW